MTDPLWTFGAAVKAAGGRAEGKGRPAIASVSIDTRSLEPGALFAAIRGERLDGHAFVAQAFAAGAACALVEDGAGIEGGGPLIRVADTLEGLNRLGAAARARADARIAAVTGSVGKTGTKEALRLALGACGNVHVSAKSHNNQWGVPLSLANMPESAGFGAFEIGMNHPGEITPLAKLVRPHVAIVTTVEPVHLEFFDSVEQIAEAKAEIFAGLEPDGTAVLNRDNPHFDLLKRRAEEAGADRIVGFGERKDADARLLSIQSSASGSQVEAGICGHRLVYRIGAPGRHLVMNSLAVLAAARVLGADLDAAAAALSGYRAQAGRGARRVLTVPGGRVLLIDESYNANPASMRAALASLGETPRADFPRRVAVLGDMLELGETSGDLHRGLADSVDAAGIDVVFACGPHMRALYDTIPAPRRGGYAETSEGVRERLLQAVGAGDVVMIKGSLGSRMGPLVEALAEHLAETG